MSDNKINDIAFDSSKTIALLGFGHLGSKIAKDLTDKSYSHMITTSIDDLSLGLYGKLDEIILDKKIVFFICGLGGHSGDDLISYLESKKVLGRDAVYVGLFSRPFSLGGNNRRKKARKQFDRLKELLDTSITIDNDRLVPNELDYSLFEVFERADSAVEMILSSLLDMLEGKGFINPDFDLMRSLLRKGKIGLVGFGRALRKDDIASSFKSSIYSPLMENGIEKTSILVICLSGKSISMADGQRCADMAKTSMGEDGKIIFFLDNGAQADEYIWIKAIALGIDELDDGFDSYEKPVNTDMHMDESVASLDEYIVDGEEENEDNDEDSIDEDEKDDVDDVDIVDEESCDEGNEGYENDEIDSLLERIDELEKTIRERDERLEDVQNMFDQSTKTIDEYERQIEDLKTSNMDTDASIEELKAQNEKLQKYIDDLTSRFSNLLVSKAKKIENLEKSIRDLTKANEALLAGLRKMDEQPKTCDDSLNLNIEDDSQRKALIDNEEVDGIITDEEIDSIVDDNHPVEEVDDVDNVKQEHLQNAQSLDEPVYEIKYDYQEEDDNDEKSLVDEIMDIFEKEGGN